jgi:RNA polymerase sigma factor (sigma-70 family)
MTTINLKDFYYWYTQDQFIEVSDEVAEVFLADARYEMAYQRRLSRHKAQYSLDCEDGIEYSACLHEPTPQELLERMELFIRLWNALNSLPEAQGRRVDACVILGKTYSEVAEAEGVDESAVRRAVERGLENMKKYLKKSR